MERTEYFQVYRDAFLEREADPPYTLSRTSGPITQNIGFQSLSYGAYRPLCGVRVVGPPEGSGLLPQMLDVQHRDVERRRHAAEWPNVLRAIEDQFVPNVRWPLDVVEVLRLAEEEAERGGNGQYFNGVATLNAHLGHDD